MLRRTRLGYAGELPSGRPLWNFNWNSHHGRQLAPELEQDSCVPTVAQIRARFQTDLETGLRSHLEWCGVALHDSAAQHAECHRLREVMCMWYKHLGKQR